MKHRAAIIPFTLSDRLVDRIDGSLFWGEHWLGQLEQEEEGYWVSWLFWPPTSNREISDFRAGPFRTRRLALDYIRAEVTKAIQKGANHEGSIY